MQPVAEVFKSPLFSNRIFLALFESTMSALLVVLPVVLVRRSIDGLLSSWQEVLFFIIVIISSGLSGLMGFGPSVGVKELKAQRHIVWVACIFVFLYIACSALCRSLNLTSLAGEEWRSAGLIIFTLGIAVRLWAIYHLGKLHSAFVTIQANHKLVRSGPYRYLRHPSYLGVLVALVGIPLIFGSWLPLAAVPGAYVALKWRAGEEEELLEGEFGQDFEDYKKRTRRFFPYIY